MNRFRLKIEYDGTAYGGWQRQKNAMTVQEKIENALFELTGEKIGITGASRTDSGVHALGQVAHFDSETKIPPEKLFLALNTHLPPDIRIAASEIAQEDFHARFMAKGKYYTYRIYNDNHNSAIMRNYSMYVPHKLDLSAMQEGANVFVGTHDFKSVMAAGSSAKTTVRTIYSFDVSKEGNLIALDVKGNGFLYNMVRIMAGTLINVGQGKMSPNDIKNALETGERTLMGFTAEPQGLTLNEVYYNCPCFGKNLDMNGQM